MQISALTLSRISIVMLGVYLSVALYHIYVRIGFDGFLLGTAMISVFFLISAKATKNHLLFLIVIASCLSLIWGVVADVQQVWDFARFYDHARKFGWDASWNWIAKSKTPMTIIIYGTGYKILNVSLYSTYIIGSLLWGAQAWLLYKICAALKLSQRVAFLSAALYLFIPSTILFATVISSEGTFLFFMLLGIYFFIKTIQSPPETLLANALLLGISFGCMHLCRGVGGIFFSILLIVLIFYWVNRRSFKLWQLLFVVTLGFVSAISPKIYANYLMTGEVTVSSHPASLWLFATGTNRDTRGRYSKADWKDLGYTSGDFEAANKNAKAIIHERIMQDPIGFAKFALNEKMDVLWGIDYAGWQKSTGGSKYLKEMSDSLLRSLMLKIGDSYHLVLIFLAVVGTALLSRYLTILDETAWVVLLVTLLCLAIGFMHLFIEVQSRYHYPIMPFVSVLATVAILISSGQTIKKVESEGSFE